MLRQLAFKCKNWRGKKGIDDVAKIHTNRTKHTVLDLFTYVATIQSSNSVDEYLFFVVVKCSLLFWNTCDLETMSRSSTLVSTGRPTPAYNYAKVENICSTVPKLEFLLNHKTCQLSPLNRCNSHKWYHIHDLLDLLNNPTPI